MLNHAAFAGRVRGDVCGRRGGRSRERPPAGRRTAASSGGAAGVCWFFFWSKLVFGTRSCSDPFSRPFCLPPTSNCITPPRSAESQQAQARLKTQLAAAQQAQSLLQTQVGATVCWALLSFESFPPAVWASRSPPQCRTLGLQMNDRNAPRRVTSGIMGGNGHHRVPLLIDAGGR